MTELTHLLGLLRDVLWFFAGVGVVVVACGLVWSLATDED